jgi:glutathione S-transferase
MDSRPIADALEAKYPSPSLHLDSPYTARTTELLPTLAGSVRTVFVPMVPKNFLNPRSEEYFVASREKSLGMPLDDYAKQGAQAFEDAKPYVKKAGEMYAENPEGPFLMGKEVSYGDVMFISWLKMMDQLGIADRFWEMEGGQALKECYDAGAKWFERDSH